MAAPEQLEEIVLHWSDAALDVQVVVDTAGLPRLSRLAPVAGPAGSTPGSRDETEPAGASGLPLLDVLLATSGRDLSGRRYSESSVGRRMVYREHTVSEDGPWDLLTIGLRDPETALLAKVRYRRLRNAAVLSSSVTLENGGDAPVKIEAVSSFLGSGLAGQGGHLSDVDIFWAENDWQAEARWHSRPFRDALPELSAHLGEGRSQGRFAVMGSGTWPSGGHLPMGAVVNRESGHTFMWQVEHNGPWQWQVGEHLGTGAAASYVSLLGPTDAEHQWMVTLNPGDSFETVPVAVACSAEGFHGGVAGLTRHRRSIRRAHDDQIRLPVIFNDYLNTLNSDPSVEKLTPLVQAAASVGAEIFCVDAGWYAEPDEHWWDTVGEWRLSEARFPNDGFTKVFADIRAAGMVPGIWIEPEVVGTRSPMADSLPQEAFFVHNDERVIERGRYQLDFRHQATRAHLDRTMDYLVGEVGARYIKMDYNINVAPGTEVGGTAPGAGLAGHARAFLAWIDSLLDRYPELTLESCASGGMRTDYATLSRVQVHSTSDQEDPLRYAPIAASVATAILPEQAAVWAAVQPDMTDDEITFTLCSAMLSRMQLSGHIDQMTDGQRSLVAQAVQVYKQIRTDLTSGFPFWPLGLPRWTDEWIAAGLRAPNATYLILWRREGQDGAASNDAITLPFGADGGLRDPEVIYPQATGSVDWNASTGELRVQLPRTPSAAVIRLESSPARNAHQEA